jgi:hypothetical protein
MNPFADDGRRGYEPKARQETVLMLIMCGLAGAVAAGLWLRFGW